MLHIEYDAGDLSRIRLAHGPDPMWETVLSLHLLQNRQMAVTFDPWRRAVRARLARSGQLGVARSLMRLAPWAAYFPDFLTPGGGTELEAGIDRVMRTPRRRLALELTQLYARTAPPTGAARLAAGEPGALQRLGEALRRYYTVAVEPYLPTIRRTLAADRAQRAEAALSGGPACLLRSYGMSAPVTDAGTVSLDYPVERGMVLHGRTLTIVPSFFCVLRPVTLADDELPPVLVQPLSPPPGWLVRNRDTDITAQPISQLIGPARALALDALETALTTNGLADRLGLAASSASRHATVLREAGLITSERRGNQVFHRRTPLGDALLNGAM